MTPADNDYGGCGSCTFAAGATPTTCTSARSVNACCDYVQSPPSTGITLSSNLHYFSAPPGDTTPDLGCLTSPGTVGTPAMVTLTGYVKLFANGDDSQGVKIDIFKEGTDGALGASVATYTTTTMDPSVVETWSSQCPTAGCNLREFSIPDVPSNTKLIIQTSDATGSGLWGDVYDYNIFITDPPAKFGTADSNCKTGPCYNPIAVAATDINSVAAAAIGASINPTQGVLAGEVHDCGDIRLSGATVDTDQPHEGPMFYFDDTEDDPLPDDTRQASDEGTSSLGLFGALDLPTGVPVRISATGFYQGKLTLLGTYVVQIFPGAVTALSLRGRGAFQTSP